MDDLGGYYSIKEKNGFITTMKVVVGGRVMLRTNSIEHSKLMNGSLGVIEDIIIEGGIVKSIMVNFDGIDDGPISIKEIMFEHPEISEIKIKAFPLIPAFAITIHKLQGQTINSP